jgi:hypothetical protein
MTKFDQFFTTDASRCAPRTPKRHPGKSQRPPVNGWRHYGNEISGSNPFLSSYLFISVTDLSQFFQKIVKRSNGNLSG